MRACIWMGSPRKQGNTAALLTPFLEELTAAGVDCKVVWLCDQDIHPCTACRACQRDWTKFGCCWQDDGQLLFDKTLESDLLVIATPIYSWYCTPPVKAAMDRMVYGMNKYYGQEKGPSLWAGKQVALLTTCGYRPEHGADLLEEGLRRYCKHSQLRYVGKLAERDLGYDHRFMDEKKADHARDFARDCLRNLAKIDGGKRERSDLYEVQNGT